MKKKILFFLYLIVSLVFYAQNEASIAIDTDKDGIIDKEDKCPTLGGYTDANGCPKPSCMLKPIEKDLYSTTLFFNSGEVKVREKYKRELDKLFKLMIDVYPNHKILIGGHTDSQEKSNKSKLLSESRALTVLGYFVSKGISCSRFIIDGYEELYPIGDNNTKEGRSQNRRIEIRIKK